MTDEAREYWLVFDVGNTHVQIGLYENRELQDYWRLSTDPRKTADEYGILVQQLLAREGLRPDRVHRIALSSVVPEVGATLLRMIQRCFSCPLLEVTPDLEVGLKICYENPSLLGVDRLVNAVAARELYGLPIVVVDFGTALTFSALSSKGEFLGGAIVPGPQVALEALATRTAQLPRAPLRVPESVLGKSPVQAIQAGVLHGYAGLVEGLIEKMAREMKEDPRVVATGGLAEVYAPLVPVIHEINPALSLEGLRILLERHQGS